MIKRLRGPLWEPDLHYVPLSNQCVSSQLILRNANRILGPICSNFAKSTPSNFAKSTPYACGYS